MKRLTEDQRHMVCAALDRIAQDICEQQMFFIERQISKRLVFQMGQEAVALENLANALRNAEITLSIQQPAAERQQ